MSDQGAAARPEHIEITVLPPDADGMATVRATTAAMTMTVTVDARRCARGVFDVARFLLNTAWTLLADYPGAGAAKTPTSPASTGWVQ